ncbi:ATP-binding cassette domain-containing protein [Nocardia yamanashiensis]|uniref:ABC-F family ATP-binding cassette domain-containing protein n=1 Tax=Nocardia yamanashiensis TaxID=209247 RepID=UPI001E3DFA6A|nr:ABC-F family ATP-binding cassette domain-containing protein [Nocardia yamanashiensis]UGT42726.1 ATP-binding cassette domain-containing protein [Nocardia yamanashiensis]
MLTLPRPTVSQLTLAEVTRRFDDRLVLDAVSLSIRPGEKAGIVGDNGSGKSTLLRLMAGRDLPDNGELIVQFPGGIGYLTQTLELPLAATVADAIDLALKDIREMELQLRAAEQALVAPGPLTDRLARYDRLLERFEARGGYQAEARVEAALHGLGLPGLDRTRALGTLSGGERRRLALAGVLASAPELLLLDEPTNDLDDTAVEWLERQLRSHRGTVVAVTHDRVFLDRITSIVLEVEAGRVARHGNGYTGYLTAKAAERRRQQMEFDRWNAELSRSKRLAESNVARLEAIPRKLPLAVFAAGPFRARGRDHGAMGRIRNAKERLARLTAEPVAPPPDRLRFSGSIPAERADAPTDTENGVGASKPATVTGLRSGPATGASSIERSVVPTDRSAVAVDRAAGADSDPVVVPDVIAELSAVTVDFRLHVAGLRVGYGDRLLVTGPNGAGKTTLLRLLSGDLAPDAGTVTVRGRVGHLRQEGSPWPAAMTVLEAFAAGKVGYPDEHAEPLLALGLFRPSELELRIGELSYGQRRRIELARLVTDPADLLLLDEPTNHLSPALVEDLEQALESYPGAVVLVTHDRRMRARFEGRRLELRAGRIDPAEPLSRSA